MTKAEKYRGTPWAVLYPELHPAGPPTEEELAAARATAYEKGKWQKQKAARKVKKTATEQVLRDNKQFANWTI